MQPFFLCTIPKNGIVIVYEFRLQQYVIAYDLSTRMAITTTKNNTIQGVLWENH